MAKIQFFRSDRLVQRPKTAHIFVLATYFCLSCLLSLPTTRLAGQCTVAFSQCPQDITLLDCDNSGGEQFDAFPPVTAYMTGNCAGLTLKVFKIQGFFPPTYLPNGAYLIIYRAQAEYSNGAVAAQADCSFWVFIKPDIQAPVFTSCPPNITVYGIDDGTGKCNAQAYWPNPTFTDNCSSTTSSLGSHPCGSIFQNGTTTVSYTSMDGSGNSATCSFTVTVICVVGSTAPGKSSFQMRISPNPNPGIFTIDLPSPATLGMAFRITDLTGRLVQEQKAEPGSALQTVRAGELPNGLYFLQVVSEGKVLAIEKFVKQ